MTYGEVWRWGTPASFAVFAVRKLLGIPMQGTVLIPREHLCTQLDPNELAPHFAETLEAESSELQALGFDLLFHYTVSSLGDASGAAVAFLHQSGRSLAFATAVRSGTLSEVSTSIVSQRTEGPFLATGNAVTRMLAPSEIEVVSLPGRSTAETAAVHLRRIHPLSVRTWRGDDAMGVLADLHRIWVEFNVRRGVYVPASDDDIRTIGRDRRGVY
jgi:hypothetical protein